MQPMPPRHWRAMASRWRFIASGPVAQFRPSTSIGYGSSAAITAQMDEPTSSVPVVSTVTDT